MKRKICAGTKEVIFPILSVLVINSHHKQFINDDMCGGWASGIIHITSNNVVIIAIKCLFTTVDRSSMMTMVVNDLHIFMRWCEFTHNEKLFPVSLIRAFCNFLWLSCSWLCRCICICRVTVCLNVLNVKQQFKEQDVLYCWYRNTWVNEMKIRTLWVHSLFKKKSRHGTRLASITGDSLLKITNNFERSGENDFSSDQRNLFEISDVQIKFWYNLTDQK